MPEPFVHDFLLAVPGLTFFYPFCSTAQLHSGWIDSQMSTKTDYRKFIAIRLKLHEI